MASRKSNDRLRSRTSKTSVHERALRELKSKQAFHTNSYKGIKETYPGDESYESRALMLKAIESHVDTRSPIEITSSEIHWVTSDVYMKNGRGGFLPINFGPFSISIKLVIDGGNRHVECQFEGTRGEPRRGGYLHPHINSCGSPCLGNVNAMLLKHMANHDAALVVCIVTDFLQTYNGESPYVRLDAWVPNIWESPTCSVCSDTLYACTCNGCLGCGATTQGKDLDDLSREACGFCATCCLTHHRSIETTGITPLGGNVPSGHITTIELNHLRETP